MIERTFVMIKPDGVARGLTEELVARIERVGLRVVTMRRERLDRARAEELYCDHREKDYFEEHIEFMLSGEVVVMLVEGDRAISGMREITGATDPRKADKGTIRGDFAMDVVHNVIHAADTPESYEREARIFFPENQL